jgi:fructokinase
VKTIAAAIATPLRIGVDLGGTKIEALALDAGGKEILRRRVTTPRDDYPQTLQTITALVTGMETDLGTTGHVGIGTPGAVSPITGLIKNANSVCLNEKPLAEDLTERLQRPVRLANDANCFALSEATDGAAAGAAVVFGVIIGTGTGGGIVVNGRIQVGRNAVAGEWGHNPLPWPKGQETPGPTCYCGRSGCIETFLSGPGLEADYHAVTGRRLSAMEINAAAQRGDAGAEAALARYVDRMARALASVVNILDPDVIVLGGGLSNLARLYQEVPRQWQRYVFSDQVTTPLLPPKFGDSSGVRGAAWLWSLEEIDVGS